MSARRTRVWPLFEKIGPGGRMIRAVESEVVIAEVLIDVDPSKVGSFEVHHHQTPQAYYNTI